MCPCVPVDLNFPDGPSGPNIPGFGQAFSLNLPDLGIGMPEIGDLSFLYKILEFLTPVGKFKKSLSSNFGKGIIDGILHLLDMFLPFLMLYKFFLPLLKIILCIIEVLCALNSPSAVIKAVKRLFRQCIPLFINLFPLIALILMIIALFLLIIKLILFLITLILKIIDLIIKEIKTYVKAFTTGDPEAILAIARKLGLELCILQNIFAIFLMIQLVIQIFQDILNNIFAIPACSSKSDCCGPEICPKFLRNGGYTNNKGTFQYNTKAYNVLNVDGFKSMFPGGAVPTTFANSFNKTVREESYQFYDTSLSHAPPATYLTEGVEAAQGDWRFQQLINMVDAKDIESKNKPIFFPTDSTYNASTAPSQAPYTVDMTFDYDPKKFNRSEGKAGKVTFKDCIVTSPTSLYLNKYGEVVQIDTGVLSITGGKGYDSDGNELNGYKIEKDSNGLYKQIPISDKATLNNFIILPPVVLLENQALTDRPILDGIDGYVFENVEYKFNINYPVLYSKGIVTAGCVPEINVNIEVINNTIQSDYNDKADSLNNFSFPNIDDTIKCLDAAITNFRANVSEQGAEDLGNQLISCLDKLKKDCEDKITQLIPVAYDQNKSSFTVDPKIQFTNQPIKVKVNLNCSNGEVLGQNIVSGGTSIISGLPEEVSSSLANKISPTITFGNISSFKYFSQEGDNTDGYYQAEITSDVPGNGTIQIAFNGKKIGKITIPENIDELPSVEPLILDYSFIYTPSAGSYGAGTSIGDQSDGQAPRRDDGDVSREGPSTGES